jgi:hypothetical protein
MLNTINVKIVIVLTLGEIKVWSRYIQKHKISLIQSLLLSTGLDGCGLKKALLKLYKKFPVVYTEWKFPVGKKFYLTSNHFRQITETTIMN